MGGVGVLPVGVVWERAVVMAPEARWVRVVRELVMPEVLAATAAVMGTAKRSRAGRAKIARRSIITPVRTWTRVSPDWPLRLSWLMRKAAA